LRYELYAAILHRMAAFFLSVTLENNSTAIIVAGGALDDRTKKRKRKWKQNYM
jgi:hypothetical protein